MPSVSSTEKVITEILEEELKTPITSNKRSWRVQEQILLCLVSLSRDFLNISHELYGNGVPGGIKLKVESVSTGLNSVSEDVEKINGRLEKITQDTSEIKEFLQINTGAQYGRRRNDLPTSQHGDKFENFLHWASDKIVPPLVVGFIVMVAQVVFFSAVLMVSITNGWITIH